MPIIFQKVRQLIFFPRRNTSAAYQLFSVISSSLPSSPFCNAIVVAAVHLIFSLNLQRNCFQSSYFIFARYIESLFFACQVQISISSDSSLYQFTRLFLFGMPIFKKLLNSRNFNGQ